MRLYIYATGFSNFASVFAEAEIRVLCYERMGKTSYKGREDSWCE